MFVGTRQLAPSGNFLRNRDVFTQVYGDEGHHDIPPIAAMTLSSGASRGIRPLGVGHFGVALPGSSGDRVRKLNHRVIEPDQPDGWLVWAEACHDETAAGRVNPFLPAIHKLTKSSSFGGVSYDAEVERLEPVVDGEMEALPGREDLNDALLSFCHTVKAVLADMSGTLGATSRDAVVRLLDKEHAASVRLRRGAPACWVKGPALPDAILLMKRLIAASGCSPFGSSGLWSDIEPKNVMLRRLRPGETPECFQPVFTDPLC